MSHWDFGDLGLGKDSDCTNNLDNFEYLTELN